MGQENPEFSTINPYTLEDYRDALFEVSVDFNEYWKRLVRRLENRNELDLLDSVKWKGQLVILNIEGIECCMLDQISKKITVYELRDKLSFFLSNIEKNISEIEDTLSGTGKSSLSPDKVLPMSDIRNVTAELRRIVDEDT